MSDSMGIYVTHRLTEVSTDIIDGAEFDADGRCINPGRRYTRQEWARKNAAEAELVVAIRTLLRDVESPEMGAVAVVHLLRTRGLVP